jgi:hypothetical protein
MATKQKIISVCVDDDLGDRIDDFRRRQQDLAAKGEAVRRLLRVGLAHYGESDERRVG